MGSRTEAGDGGGVGVPPRRDVPPEEEAGGVGGMGVGFGGVVVAGDGVAAAGAGSINCRVYGPKMTA